MVKSPSFVYLYLKAEHTKNPAEVLLLALRFKNLDARLTEALPWVLLEYPDLDWKWLVSQAKANELQNKLGFLTNVARISGSRRLDPCVLIAGMKTWTVNPILTLLARGSSKFRFNFRDGFE